MGVHAAVLGALPKSYRTVYMQMYVSEHGSGSFRANFAPNPNAAFLLLLFRFYNLH